MLFLLFVILYVAMEFAYLTLTKDMYQRHFAQVTGQSQAAIARHITTRTFPYVIIVYVLLIGVLWYFVFRHVHDRSTPLRTHTMNAALMGLAIYGVYNLTNLITLPDYTLRVACIDTLWGMGSLVLLITFITWLHTLLSKK